MNNPKIDKFLSELTSKFDKNKYSTNLQALIDASKDESSFDGVKPICVFYPLSTDDVKDIVKLSYQYEISITPRGAGTSLEGNSIPLSEGIVIDLSRMNNVINIDEENMQVIMEPGVIYEVLNNKLKYTGLFFPPSPGGSSDTATIGGMVSTNASGIYTFKYGDTKRYVQKLKVVTGSGDILSIGTNAVKTSSGYQLMNLFIGSEGTLGIITEITLRLIGVPEMRYKTAYTFPSEEDTVKAVTTISRLNTDLSAIEYLDKRLINALNKLKGYNLTECPYLFLEYHSYSEKTLEISKANVDEILSDFGGKEVLLPNNENPWEIRHHSTTAVKLLHPNLKIIRNDVAFPISKIPEMTSYAYNLASERNIELFIFGHIGIGLIHALILADIEDKTQWNKAQDVKNKIIEKSIELGGTISGEHGIGLAHRKHLKKEHGDAVDWMKKLKNVFDPKNILNPDKIFLPHY